jgi:hypothetical protein
MHTIEKNVGRLIEAQIGSPLTLADVESIVQQTRLHVLGVQGKAVCCVDLTLLYSLPLEATEAFVALFTRDNPRIERSGFLVARRQSSIGLQMDRMIRQGNNPARQSFEERRQVQQFLDEVLTPPESQRLRQFLLSSSSPPSSGKMPVSSG